MKNPTRALCSFLLLFSCGAFAYGASLPPIEVTVSNASGKEVFKGTTDGRGAFATRVMPAGQYVVAFNSKASGMAKSKFGIVVSAGKNQMSADSVAGARLADPGVAMRITVNDATKIVGQIGNPGTKAKSVAAVANPAAGSDARVKIINGKRYVWVTPPGLGVSGGQWVEESEAAKQKADDSVRPSESHTGKGY